MYGIDLLTEEHQNILKFTEYLKSVCLNIFEYKEMDTELIRECIEFGRNYADKQHHGKEEKILFRVMLDTMESAAEKLIRNGMLVEHDLGRYHLTQLENAADRYDLAPDAENMVD